MFINTIMLLISALALAATAGSSCVLETKYRLTMLVDTEAAALHAIDNGPDGSVVLVANPELTTCGTIISESGASGSAVLNLDITPDEPFSTQNGTFSLSVADLGDLHGVAAPVLGSKDAPWPHWYTTFERIWPQQTSGAQLFFACYVDIGGKTYQALSWGAMASNGSMPLGCYMTVVGKVHDVSC